MLRNFRGKGFRDFQGGGGVEKFSGARNFRGEVEKFFGRGLEFFGRG